MTDYQITLHATLTRLADELAASLETFREESKRATYAHAYKKYRAGESIKIPAIDSLTAADLEHAIKSLRDIAALLQYPHKLI